MIDTATWAVDEAATSARQAAIRAKRGWKDKQVPKVQWTDPIPRELAATAKAAE